MVIEAIQYDTSLFMDILNNKVYNIKNTIEVNKCLEDFEKNNDWVKMSVDQPEENKWSPINHIPVNFLCMTVILNTLNIMLADIQNNGITDIDTDEGEIIPASQLDFMQNHMTNTEGFEMEFGRFHKLLHEFKDEILSPESPTYRVLLSILSKSMTTGEEKNLFVRNVQTFFPGAIDVKISKKVGNIFGIDVTFSYRGQEMTVDVQNSSKIEKSGEYYKIFCGINPQIFSQCKFYAFILPNNYIYIFENDKSKIRNVEGNDIFDKTPDVGLSYLFHTELFKNYLKVF